MTKQEYYKLAATMPNRFLIDVLNAPTSRMTRTHRTIIKVILRKRGVIDSTMPIYRY